MPCSRSASVFSHEATTSAGIWKVLPCPLSSTIGAFSRAFAWSATFWASGSATGTSMVSYVIVTLPLCPGFAMALATASITLVHLRGPAAAAFHCDEGARVGIVRCGGRYRAVGVLHEFVGDERPEGQLVGLGVQRHVLLDERVDFVDVFECAVGLVLGGEQFRDRLGRRCSSRRGRSGCRKRCCRCRP